MRRAWRRAGGAAVCALLTITGAALADVPLPSGAPVASVARPAATGSAAVPVPAPTSSAAAPAPTGSAAAPAGSSAPTPAPAGSAQHAADVCNDAVEAWAKAASRRTGLTIHPVACFVGLVRVEVAGAGCDFELTRNTAFQRTKDGAFGVSPIVNLDWSTAPEPMQKALAGLLSALEQDPSLHIRTGDERGVRAVPIAIGAGVLVSAALAAAWLKRRKGKPAATPTA